MDMTNDSNSNENSVDHAGLTPEQIEAEFDPRLSDVWLAVFLADLSEGGLRENLSSFMRMSYLKGYEDALTESVPGSLHRNLGLAPPVRGRSDHAPTARRRSVKGGRR